MSDINLEQRTVNVLKGLVIDGVHAAKSGHPGGAMSSMDFAYVLFTEFLKYNPDDPTWLARDRFVLSAGHESMLLYSLLHMIGWLPIEELKKFRQLHSMTPGHPENFVTKGVECTTGPLGQGAAMSVGFAIAASHLGAKLGEDFAGHKTYSLLGDGCMQEDVTLGAASLAGHLQLNNLIWYYDQNRCQISGTIDRATSDDEKMIFAGFGWEVISIDGHDRAAIRRALIKARSSSRPVLIIGQTVMAQGTATMENDHETHGAPLPNEERAATKAKFGFPKDQDFYVPQDALDHFRRRQNELRVEVGQWQQNFDKLSSDAEWKKKYSENFGSDNWSNLPAVEWPVDKAVATRNAFGDVLKSWAQAIPKLMGGSADLEPSNMTGPYAKAVGDFQRNNRLGRNLAFGVREFPMSAIANGMALHGGVIPFDATFLSFADYSRPALRLGAIQRCRVLHEFSHDSFYLGEDGPTHQPVEHVMSLRLIPNFYVMRPADAYETQVMMRCALNLQAPSAICVSRQKLPILSVANRQDAERGAYLVHGSLKDQTVIFATGSEVSLAVEVAKKLGDTKVVSIPCWEIFDEQDPSYRDQIVDWSCPRRISIEAGATLGWQRFTGERGLNIGLDHFGDSAPMEQLAEAYGFTSGQVEARIRAFFKL